MLDRHRSNSPNCSGPDCQLGCLWLPFGDRCMWDTDSPQSQLITGHARCNCETKQQKWRFDSSHAGEMMALQYTGLRPSSDILPKSCTWPSARRIGILRDRITGVACSFSTAEIQHHSTNVCNERFVLTWVGALYMPTGEIEDRN